MFRYLAHGVRRYGLKPVSYQKRRTWEIEAVLDGRISPTLNSGGIPYQTRTIWAIPPHVPHGWTGERGHPAEVVVFHPLHVPEQLKHAASAAEHDGCLFSVSLIESDVAWLRRSIMEAISASKRPDYLSELRLERLMLDLTVLILERTPKRWRPASRPDPAGLVTRVIAWLEEHVDDGAGIEDACQACGCSSAHLRRLFHRFHKTSPRDALRVIRLRQADRLLADRSMRLSEIAESCGFASAATLCRSYSSARGTPPRRLHRDREFLLEHI
jgi:AraC-like DNA-binding protein